MTAPTWTEAHRREARIAFRSLALAAEIAGKATLAYDLSTRAGRSECVSTEEYFRAVLRDVGGGYDEAARDRIVSRVRALAEGRLVRETVWVVRWEADAFDLSGQEDVHKTEPTPADRRGSRRAGGTTVRVTRIRKAPAGGVGR